MSSFKCHIKVYTIILRKGENLMRTLAYRVEGQRLEPIGDHSGIKAGSKGYLRARFEFNEDWDGCIKVASFYYGGIEYACMLDKDDSCDIYEDISYFELKEIINDILNTLTPRQKQVLLLRYGFDNNEFKNLEEVGKLIGISREGTRKALVKAFKKIRDNKDLKDYLNY